MQGFFEEKDITLSLLEKLFRSAQYEASIFGESDFRVLAETALVAVDVLAENNQRFIRFTSMYKLKDGVEIEKKMDFANGLNNQVALARFSIHENDPVAMNVEYFLPFWGGISAYHIIAAFRVFVFVYTSVPSSADKNNIIQYGAYPSLTMSPRLWQ